MQVTDPLNGDQENLFVAMADPVEEKLLHMVTADPARTPTFTPFAQGDYFLNALVDAAVRRTTTSTLRVPAERGRGPTRRSRGTTAASSRRSDRPGSARSGRASRRRRRRDATEAPWTDHTDIRPTMLALLGLKDDYVSDGRVVTEILKGDALPEVAEGQARSRSSARPTSRSTPRSGSSRWTRWRASTGALASNTSGDSTYTNTENALQPSARDATRSRGQIRLALWNAEFNGQKLDDKQAKDWIDQADDLLDRASALAASFNSSRPTRRSSGRSTTSWSSTRRTTASTTSTAAGRA